jgi:hypothetical protein
MKKALVAIVILLIVVLSGVYILIPSNLRVAEAGKANITLTAAKRFVFEQQNWPAWFDSSTQEAGRFRHTVTNTFFTQTDILIADGPETHTTTIRLIPLDVDSIGLEWDCSLPTGYNPFTRIGRYKKALELKEHMDSLMSRLLVFLNDKSRVYGTTVYKDQLRDRPLMSRRVVMKTAPTAQDAYQLIASARAFARRQGDTTNGPAMKYAAIIDSASYELMIAVPTAKMLKGNKDFVPKGLVGGNLIATKVQGGESALRNAWKGIEQYKTDYRLASPAIPFELMITDREKEPDTSKWQTIIYYPIRF